MKILFLDVDGVLNRVGTKERCPNGCIGVEPDLCARLERVVSSTGCSIVLSSTWRLHPDILPYLWNRVGDTVASCYIGDTPSAMGGGRSREVRDYLESSK